MLSLFAQADLDQAFGQLNDAFSSAGGGHPVIYLGVALLGVWYFRKHYTITPKTAAAPSQASSVVAAVETAATTATASLIDQVRNLNADIAAKVAARDALSAELKSALPPAPVVTQAAAQVQRQAAPAPNAGTAA
ncbi:MAG TPA: hypothetical protein VG713_18000 [Pirellulales bacterium]|nr:hypothetical protein [Pirellulales bacterium]